VPPVKICAGKNWCIDRTQTCGPAGGYGQCLVDAFGGNICAELLFQVASCDECGPANCTNCRCVPAAGSSDKCNNGANGYDFVCVRRRRAPGVNVRRTTTLTAWAVRGSLWTRG
jgi:hypothetical protein